MNLLLLALVFSSAPAHAQAGGALNEDPLAAAEIQQILERRNASQQHYTETDLNYPFFLDGFGEDILHCSSIVPEFKGNKICLSCQPGSAQDKPAANSTAERAGPSPAFDAVAFLNTRYGYRPGFQGPLYAPLEDGILRNDFSTNRSWQYDTSESYQHAVPTFCQAYYDKGLWRLLLVVAMYHRRYQTAALPVPRTVNKLYEGLDPIRYVAFSFQHTGKSWKLVREKKTYANLDPHKRRRLGEYPFSLSGQPGQGILRLWKMPNSQFALLDVQFVSEEHLVARTKLVASIYLLDQEGTLLKPVQVEMAHMDFRELDYQTLKDYSSLKVLKLRSGLEFIQTNWAESQSSGEQAWVSEKKMFRMQVEKGKQRGRFTILWLF